MNRLSALLKLGLRYGALLTLVALSLTMAWPGLAQNLLASDGFMEHGHCYLWEPQLVWLHVSSDLLIGLSYVAISSTLAYLVYRARRDVPFHWMFLAFGLFIVSCGGTHFMEVWTVWTPVYWLSGDVKLITAVASVGTALALPPLVPRIQALIQSAKVSEERRVNLLAANEELSGLYAKLKELDQLKTEFFANVSHELRTPLTLIAGPTESLLASDSLSHEQRRKLESIARNAQLLLKHVNDLLDVSKLDAGQMKLHYTAVNLAQLVRVTASHFESVAYERGINFAVETPQQLAAEVDIEKTERVLLNLLANAVKFTPAGGRIECALTVADSRATLRVADTGPGVPVNARAVIFERFQQVESAPQRVGGTGLGLAIAKEFVELHGGTITVDDAPGGGARFTLSLPLRAPEGTKVGADSATTAATAAAPQALAEFQPTQTAPPTTSPTTSTQTATEDKPLVLIIEDNVEMNHFIRDVLRDEYRTVQAFDGEIGLAQARALRPDLILSDVMMPRLSGEELVARVRAAAELDATPIVLLTARTDEELRVRLLREGAQDYLMKPFAAEELRARTRNLIVQRRARQVLQQTLESRSQDLSALATEVAERNRKLAQAYQQVEEASRLKDDFLAVVSHELRQPLNIILGWISLVREGQLGPTEERRALATVESSARAQKQLIEDLLDVSRITTGKLRFDVREVDLEPVIRAAVEAARPAAEAKAIRLQITIDPRASHIAGDANRLQQMVWNLLSNAIKFTPKGGRAQVRLERVNSHVEIVVSDTGQGIKPEFLPYVFDRFRQQDASSTRAHGGMGLGLAIVRHLTELHGGAVKVESEGEGRGATFTISLPLVAARATGEFAHPTAEPLLDEAASYWADKEAFTSDVRVRLTGVRVLVLDDERATRELIATILTGYGAVVTQVGSASEALACLVEAQPATRFDVIVSDIEMPVADGYEFMRQVRALNHEQGGATPATALTAYARTGDRLRALAAGFQMHVTKPVEPIELVTVVASLARRIGEPEAEHPV